MLSAGVGGNGTAGEVTSSICVDGTAHHPTLKTRGMFEKESQSE